MAKQPLAEVFGFPITNQSEEARRFRNNRLCPYNNGSPNCTKTSQENPLGVCSVYGSGGEVVITCPTRFRESWLIASDAAEFFFPAGTTWTSVTEVQLNDHAGKSAGNIDVVLISYDEVGRVLDYGALEVQAVYISGNVRTPFAHYMEDPSNRQEMDWSSQRNYPRPDYLSSSRKRLAPQLIFKGGILNTWRRKMAVALNRGFFNTLPVLDEVDPTDADIAWMIYDLEHHTGLDRYQLVKHRVIYTKFEAALLKITRSEAGEESRFLNQLQSSLNRRLSREGNSNGADTS